MYLVPRQESRPTVTVDDLKQMDSAWVGTLVASQALGCERYSLNVAAKQGMLGIPFFFSGNRLKISRMGIINFLEGKMMLNI